jgi:hypothetical protein
MAKLTYAEVNGIRSSLNTDMLKQKVRWRLLSHFIAPERLKDNVGDNAGGTKSNRHIVKNQGGRSLRTFVSGLMNGATPRARPWFNLTVNNTRKAASTASRKYFTEVEAILNSRFQVSNLYRVLPMAYKDVGIFSNGAFAMLPHVQYGFYFYPFAIGTYGFSTDAEGNTNMFYRDFSMTVKQVVGEFAKLGTDGKADLSNLPHYVQDAWKSARYLETIVLSNVIVPNSTYNPKKVSLDPLDRKFQSYTFITGRGGNGIPSQSPSGFRNEKALGENEFIKVTGYSYFPVITPRWEVAPEEHYGVDGPGDIALGDIMTLQEMEKSRLVAIDKLLRPPMVGHASLRRHQASILAGGITYVDDNGAAAGFKPAFQMDPKVSELIMDQREYTDSIKAAFFEDLFLMLSGGESKTHITAREIEEKASERMATLAPVLGQLDQDLNSKLITNAQIILEEAGLMPVKPKELEGEQLRPEYISILAQAAKVSMMTSMERTMNFASSVSQAMQDPSLMRLMKGEDMIRKYADYTAMDPTLIADEDEFADIKEAVAAQQAEQAAMMQQQQAAATAKDLSSATLQEGGSMLDKQFA